MLVTASKAHQNPRVLLLQVGWGNAKFKDLLYSVRTRTLTQLYSRTEGATAAWLS